jgi:hypothetical protein
MSHERVPAGFTPLASWCTAWKKWYVLLRSAVHYPCLVLCQDPAVQQLGLLLFQVAKAGKSSRLILSKKPGNVLLRVSYKWAIGYDWVSLGLSRI